MNANDLPPAAKLAALIEAGRAANPDLKHGHNVLLYNGAACALGFACLGVGAPRERINGYSIGPIQTFLADFAGPLTDAVIAKNDGGASLDGIILSLREGELAKAPA